MNSDVDSTAIDRSAIEQRAAAPLSVTPRPFVRWAGSKRLVLEHVVPHLPLQIGTYFEPFLGSGALFFLLEPTRAVLSDTCRDLVETYEAIRDSPRSVLNYLSEMKSGSEAYYEVREKRSRGRLKYAAEFIYLNKMCWNGLYRVNSNGKFNVPYGRPRTDNLVDENNLRACSKALNRPNVWLSVVDFEESVAAAEEGDLVFFDPPYVTGHRNNGFVDYNEHLFSWNDQKRLAVLAHELRERGCSVVVTNADHDEVVNLYPDFESTRFSRKSTIAGDGSMRTRTTELILVGSPES